MGTQNCLKIIVWMDDASEKILSIWTCMHVIEWYNIVSAPYHIRFTPEEKAKRPQLAHMPFGFGPRSCIGMRFALLEAKMALIEVLQKYTFVRAPDTEVNTVRLSMHVESANIKHPCHYNLTFCFRFHCRQSLVLPCHLRMAFISKSSTEVNLTNILL